MEYLIKSAAIVTLFYVCYKLFLEKETYFVHNRFFLVSGLIISLVIPFIVIPIYVVKEPVNFDFITTTQVTQDAMEQSSFDYLKLGIYIYLLGVSVLLLKSIIEVASLKTILKSCTKQKDKGLMFLKTPRTISPFSFFNMIVYNPEMFNANELKHVIDHEKVHAKQWHSVDVMLSQIACVLLWFNPIVWLYKKELQQNLEFIADQTAQGQSDCTKTYQHLLLKTSVPNNQLVLANYFYNSLIKKRIVMLHKNPSHKRKLWKLLAIFPLLAAFMFTFNTKVIAQSKDKEKKVVVEKIDTKVIQFVISKDSDDQELDKIKGQLKEHGVTANFKKIKRNSNNEITSISINASGKKSNANFSIDNETPIFSISITYNATEDNLSIGNGKKVHYASGKNMVFTSKDNDKVVIEIEEDSGDGTYFYTTSDGKNDAGKKKVQVIELKGDAPEVIELKESDDHVYVIRKDVEVNGDDHEEEKEIKVIVTPKDKDKLKWVDESEDEIKILNPDKKRIFISESDSDPLIFIDDKEATKEAMDKLDPKEIKSVNAWKGDKAIEKYGDKAKGGVIEIYTQKP